MTPFLSRRGRLCATSGGLFLLAGAATAQWFPCALGAVVLAAMFAAYAAFFPAFVRLGRGTLVLAWWTPPGDQPGGALTAECPFPMIVLLRNKGSRACHVAEIAVVGPDAVEVQEGTSTILPARAESELVLTLRAKAAGTFVLQGAILTIADPLCLLASRVYFPNPLAIKVFPRLAAPNAMRTVEKRVAGAPRGRTSLHTLRRRGLAGDLRELREHAPGDPFKAIAWKATARQRRLMVRELETEVVVTHRLCLDVAGSMRLGELGATPLDAAIETACALARASLDGGDRVGLVTFDTRVVTNLAPDEGRSHFLSLVDLLLETKSIVDEDLTDVTDGELADAVARHLAAKESVDVGVAVAPDVSDPAWAQLLVGPRGELYDALALSATLAALGGGAADEQAPLPTRLRAFCKERGIALAHRTTLPPGARAHGLADALAKGTAGAQRVTILTDLAGLAAGAEPALRALAMARQRQREVVVVVPTPPRSVTDEDPALAAVYEVARHAERLRLDAARRRLAALSVPVIRARPEEAIALISRRFAAPALRARTRASFS